MVLNSLEQQIDHLLEILRKHQSTLYLIDIEKKVKESEIKIEPSVLRMLIEKLVRDKYIFQDHSTNDLVYCISYEGNLFQGYVKQVKTDLALTSRHNIRDFVLSWGTVLAGLAGIGLLAWQIYSFFHPVPSPCELINAKK